MCGICGFNWEDKKLVQEMAKAISHRGPNQEGTFTDEGISFGHKRLSILDLSTKGKQPMFTKEGDLCITYNGEIYNFWDIRSNLEKKGYTFDSNTDTEVILYAYKEYGKDCLQHFNGMFAFAIWDFNTKELFVARDRIGIKPLYYYFQKGQFLFASELKSLLQFEGIKRELNDHCLSQIIHYAYPINGESLIKHINELLPGHYLLLKGEKLTYKKYWDVSIHESSESIETLSNQLRELLKNSVQRRLISDVPLGITLSGGLDSGIITSLANNLQEQPVKTFTIGFDIPDSEFKAAQIVADHCKTDHTAISLDYSDFTQGMMNVLWHMEYPISRPAMVPVYYLYEKLSKHVTVSLTGDGADEIFGGYNRYDAYTLPSQNEAINSKISMDMKNKKNYISSGVFNKDKKDFFTSSTLKLTKNLTSENRIHLGKPEEQLNQVLLYELKTGIPYFHCNKLDRNSMAHSHETRVPFLDHTIVEFGMTVPSQHKFFGDQKKLILQKVAQPLLPKETVQRRKLPMVIPLHDFFAEEFKDIADSVLSVSNLKKRPYYKIR